MHFKSFLPVIFLVFVFSIALSKEVSGELKEGIKAIKIGDYVSAYKEFTPLAKKGNPTAQFYLGQMYRLGLYVNQDHQKSYKWYTKSAKQGVPFAQFYLGNIYLRGTGVPIDITKAKKWYIKAANQGHIIAQYHLGRMYQRGDGVSPNDQKALKWFKKAAIQGYILAQYKLGLLYITGEGVPKDFVQAHMWLNISSKIGKNKVAIVLMKTIEKDMTSLQIQRAKSLAREWVKDQKKNKDY